MSNVMLSVDDDPVSLPDARSGTEGVLGGVSPPSSETSLYKAEAVGETMTVRPDPFRS